MTGIFYYYIDLDTGKRYLDHINMPVTEITDEVRKTIFERHKDKRIKIYKWCLRRD